MLSRLFRRGGAAAPDAHQAGGFCPAPGFEQSAGNAQQQSTLTAPGSTPGYLEQVGEPTGRPFEAGASRGDFVWALRRDHGGAPSASRFEAVAWAQQRGLLTAGREDDPITRAEAAVVLRRHLGLPQELPEGQIAYFSDVDPSAWFFVDAHVARRHGLFVGSGNRLRGDDPISAAEAQIVIGRVGTAQPVTPEQQSPGIAPMLTPDSLAGLLDGQTLDHDQIALARERIATRPEGERAALYEQVAAAVRYRNQRDNEGTYAASDARSFGYARGGDVMCNVTSIAMALNQLGIGVDESSKQFEDLLDELMVEERLGSRYELGGQSATAAAFGAATERVWVPSFTSGAAAQAYYEAHVLPRLEQGAAATLSIMFGPQRAYAHIVRLEWVKSDGLLVDDPFGRIYHSGSHYTYERNDVASESGDGARGEDRLWSWDTVAALNRGRYVQFLTKASDAVS